MTDLNLHRPSDAPMNHGDPAKAKVKFGWSSADSLEGVVGQLIAEELDSAL